MANIIQIKHGTGVPDYKLAPYELGYMDDSGHLYIGGPYENEETKTYGTARTLNYLPLDKNGYIPILKGTERLIFQSTDDFPKVKLTSTQYAGEVDYCASSSNGRAYILEWPILASGKYYERYNFPIPSNSLTENITYTILTTKGGTFGGNFTFSGKLTANGAVVVDNTSYGTKDPNTAGPNGTALSGTTGQLYFVIAGD